MKVNVTYDVEVINKITLQYSPGIWIPFAALSVLKNIVNCKEFANTICSISWAFLELFLVDGGLTKWSEFNACSVTCGTGVQTRQRSCTNPSPKNNGKECTDALTEEKDCFNKHCPSKFKFGWYLGGYLKLLLIKHKLKNTKLLSLSKLLWPRCFDIFT